MEIRKSLARSCLRCRWRWWLCDTLAHLDLSTILQSPCETEVAVEEKREEEEEYSRKPMQQQLLEKLPLVRRSMVRYDH